jgi:acyl transferase domain-containing protein
MQERVAFVARSVDEWIEQLETFVRNEGKGHQRNVLRGTAGGAGNLDVADTEAGRAYVRQLLSSNECAKVAELWVKGTKIDWTALHGA